MNPTLVVGDKCVTGSERLRVALETWLARRGHMTLVTRAVIESSDGLLYSMAPGQSSLRQTPTPSE
jgi:hypothetical protein